MASIGLFASVHENGVEPFGGESRVGSGAPIGTPSFLLNASRAMTQPSPLLATHTGFPRSFGSKLASTE